MRRKRYIQLWLRPAVGIPMSASSLIGRSDKVAEVTALLRRADMRLLTLSGPDGAGKTWLAIEAAHMAAGDFADGTAFAPLMPVGLLSPTAMEEPLHCRSAASSNYY